jgi:hypothetical protein
MRRPWPTAIGGLLCAVALVAQVAAAEGRAARRARKPADGKPAAECQKNEDCVLVTDGCCGCHEGGKQRAIPGRAKAAYEKKRKSICRDTACPALMSDDPSCLAGEAVCKEGTCKLRS